MSLLDSGSPRADLQDAAEPAVSRKARCQVTLLLPVLNEIDGLRIVLPQVDRQFFTEILIVDGGSTDGSLEFADAQGIRVVRQTRQGLSFGVFDALREAQGDYVIEFSPDGNCLVEQLPHIVSLLEEGYDMVVVSRYLPPARSEDDTWVTAIGNFLFTRMIRWLGRQPMTDALTIYRGFHKDLALNPEFERYLVGPVFEPLLSAMAALRHRNVIEIPGDEPKRLGGKQKMRVIYNGSCVLLMILRMWLLRLGLRT